MALNKSYSYSVFIGPDISGGWNYVNHSGLFSKGGIKAIQGINSLYPNARLLASSFATAGVGSVYEDVFDSSDVLVVEATGPSVSSQCSVDISNYPVSGFFRLCGQVYIPSSNTSVTRAAISVGNTVVISTGFNQWNDINSYFRNTNTSNNSFVLSLRDGNVSNDSSSAPSIAVSDGDKAYFRNIKLFLDSGVVPFTGDSHISFIQQLDLVQDLSLDLNNNITDLKEIGKFRMNSRDNVYYPDGTVTISYLQSSLQNEFKLGWNCNFSDYIFHNGRARYTGYNYDVMLNLTGTSLSGFASGFLYPFNNNRSKNLFLHVNTNNSEERYLTQETGVANVYDQSYTIGLGNAYLKSYRVVGSYNTLPLASVSYNFFNLTNQPEDYGLLPSIHRESGSYITGQYYWLPKFSDKEFSFVQPQRTNINIDYQSSFVNLSGIVWQEYDFSIDFAVKQNERLGYCIPSSCDIQTPNKISIRLQGLATEEQEFYLTTLKNSDINLSISNFACTGNGLVEKIRYDFRGCKIDNVQSNYSIGRFNSITLSLTQELTQPKNGKGFFISGHLWNNPNRLSKGIALPNKNYPIDFIVMTGNHMILNA